MFTFDKVGLEECAELCALAGAAFTASKFCVTHAQERSVDRKLSKTSDQIDSILGRLMKLRDQEALVQEFALASVEVDLRYRLHEQVSAFDKLLAKRAERIIRATQDPSPLRSFLMLYRPAGFVGMLAQLFYLISCAYTLVVLVLFVSYLRASYSDPGDGGLEILFLIFVLPTCGYFRGASFRLKQLSNAVRLGQISSPNRDMAPWRRWSLVLTQVKGMYLQRLLYYLFALFSMMCTREDFGDGSVWTARVLPGIVFLCLAIVIRSDVLARRALLLRPVGSL